MEEEKTLFERLGGSDAVDAAVDIFYKKNLEDERVKHYFSHTDMDKLRGMQKGFMSFAFGAPIPYTGKGMAAAHAGMSISAEEFDAVAGNLVATLSEMGVDKSMIDEVVAIVAPLKDDVINK